MSRAAPPGSRTAGVRSWAAAVTIALLIHGAVILLPVPDIQAPAPPPDTPPPVLRVRAAPRPAATSAPAPATDTSAPAPATDTSAPAPATDTSAPAPATDTSAAPTRPRARPRSDLAPRATSRPEAIATLPVEDDTPAAAAPPVERVIPQPGAVEQLLPADSPGAPAPAASFDADAYAARIRARIDAHKRYPTRARRRGLEGVATVIVEVTPAGHLAAPPRLARTSGVAALDREALRMARAAAPYPPPAGARAAPLVLHVPVRFALNEPVQPGP